MTIRVLLAALVLAATPFAAMHAAAADTKPAIAREAGEHPRIA